jgi:hypothetical protein
LREHGAALCAESRGCPRNCKRRVPHLGATEAIRLWEGKAWTAKREPGDLPSSDMLSRPAGGVYLRAGKGGQNIRRPIESNVTRILGSDFDGEQSMRRRRFVLLAIPAILAPASVFTLGEQMPDWRVALLLAFIAGILAGAAISTALLA